MGASKKVNPPYCLNLIPINLLTEETKRNQPRGLQEIPSGHMKVHLLLPGVIRHYPIPTTLSYLK